MLLIACLLVYASSRHMAHEARPAFPVWLPAGTNYPITEKQFKSIVMGFLSRITRGGLVKLNDDPFFQAIASNAGGHIARVFVCKEAARNPLVTGEAANIYYFPLLDADGIAHIVHQAFF